MPNNIYCPMHHRQSLITTPLSHESEKLARFPFPQFLEEIQDLPDNYFLQGRTLTARSWDNKVKIKIFERAGVLLDQAIKLPLNPIDLVTQQTCRKIAELGTANETFLYAQEWLDHLREIAVSNKMWWCEPLVNLGINSEIVFEWWYGNKKLTVYILENISEYVQVWGPDIDNQMQEGSATSSSDITSLWTWLVT